MSAQTYQPSISIKNVVLDYNGKSVRAKKLTVSSEIPIPIDLAWNNVKTPALLQFIAKGMIKFKATEGSFPEYWKAGKTYGAKMRIFGFIPFGGTHYLSIESVNDDLYEISTKEWDNRAKIWNHRIKMRDLGNGIIHYEDSIIIYGGALTGFITQFAKIFYKHRQKRWQIVAKEELRFGSQ